jgi:hypothetical protein
VIDDEVGVGARNQGGELFEQLLGLEGNVVGAITPRRLETDKHPTVRSERQAIFGDGRPQKVTAELLETRPALGADLGVRMQIESAKPRLSATLGLVGCRFPSSSDTEDACAGTFPGRDPVTDRSGVEGVQRRRFLCFDVFAGLLAQQPSAHQQPQDSFSNRTEKRLDFVVGRRSAGYKSERAIRFSNEHPVKHERVEVDIQIERATESLDDGHRPRASLGVPRFLDPFPVEAK